VALSIVLNVRENRRGNGQSRVTDIIGQKSQNPSNETKNAGY
jgi:hypothetical protein